MRYPPNSLALRWTQLTRFYPGAKKGLAGKVAAAVLQAARKLDCLGTVCVYDEDGHPERLAEMEEGGRRGVAAVGQAHLVVCGLAVRSVEAWTLGAPEAIAGALDVDLVSVQRQYPHSRVEELNEHSGKPERRPKALLDRIAGLRHQQDSTELREAVAERTDPASLERACSTGFGPFAQKFRGTFGALR